MEEHPIEGARGEAATDMSSLYPNLYVLKVRYFRPKYGFVLRKIYVLVFFSRLGVVGN